MYPPNYDEIAKRFPVRGRQTVVFTYGDTIYNPLGRQLAADVIAHEEVHIKQQAEYPGGPERWWTWYLLNSEFRLEQEIEAYRVQVSFARRAYSTKDAKLIAAHCVRTLSSPMYGGIVSSEEAKKLLYA
jgi:hypothetical protein